jgi:beta-phosphoglucomutase-like phosphatase (HAD superfamily)
MEFQFMSKNTTQDQATHALIFELEYVAAQKRPVEYVTLKSAMKKKGVELTPILFSKSAMSPRSRDEIVSILKLVGKKYDAIEKAVNEMEKAVTAFCEKDATLQDGVVELIQEAQKRGVAVFALTALPEELAQTLMTKLGLDKLNIELMIPDEIKETFPRADSWLKLLKKYDYEDRTLVTVVSSKVACKGALTAGAACVVVPDELTAFQDFAGAALVLDSLSDVKPAELLDLTLRM